MRFGRFLAAGVAASLLFGCSQHPRHADGPVTQAPPPVPVAAEPMPPGPLLVVFFDRESSAPQIEQRLLLRSERKVLLERGITVLFAWERVEDLDGRALEAPSGTVLRQALGVSPLGFSVVLVDRAGAVRWTGNTPTSPSLVAALHDAYLMEPVKRVPTRNVRRRPR